MLAGITVVTPAPAVAQLPHPRHIRSPNGHFRCAHSAVAVDRHGARHFTHIGFGILRSPATFAASVALGLPHPLRYGGGDILAFRSPGDAMTCRLFRRHRPRRVRAWTVLIVTVMGLILSGALWTADCWIDQAALPYSTDRIDAVPPVDVALVLGTSPRVAGHRRNLFFEYRLDAAAQLLKTGKVKFLLVSGDNREKGYDEPTAMRDGLIARGVPADAIYRDFAGVRTLDSVLRARDVFAQSRYVVVSQAFHNHRAIWLARQHGIEAYGFDARDVPFALAPQVWLRQYLSAARAIYDVLAGSTSRHDGPRIEIGRAPPT